MAFHTEKDLKSKNVRWKKVYILAKDVNTERKFKIKQIKKVYFLCTLIQAVKVKLLGLFLKIFIL